MIAANVIAVPLAGPQHVSSNAAAPTVAISGVWKDDWIIVTGNASTGAGRHERA
ncbi:MAG TPA: hypothetical protein VF742_09330 [Terracidiphilus sp.]